MARLVVCTLNDASGVSCPNHLSMFCRARMALQLKSVTCNQQAFIAAVCQCLYLLVQDDDLVVSSSPTRRARTRSSLEMDAYPSHVSAYDEYSQYVFVVALCKACFTPLLILL